MEQKINFRRFTISFVHYCYKNLDIIEDSHATSGFHMSLDFYKEVYPKVKERLDTALSSFEAAIQVVHKRKTDELTLDNPITKFLFEVVLFSYGYDDWEEPVLLDIKVNDDYVAFLLEGEFLNHCKNNMTMEDTDMKEINIDIVNRMYTLLSKTYMVRKN